MSSIKEQVLAQQGQYSEADQYQVVDVVQGLVIRTLRPAIDSVHLVLEGLEVAPLVIGCLACDRRPFHGIVVRFLYEVRPTAFVISG